MPPPSRSSRWSASIRRSFRWRRRLRLLLFGALAGAVLAGLASSLSDLRLFALLGGEAANLSGREQLWPLFAAAAEGSPWVGWGVGAGNAIIPPDSLIAKQMHTWAAHNEYLRMAWRAANSAGRC